MKKFAILCLILAGCAAPEVKNESVWTVRQMQGAPAEEAGIGQGFGLLCRCPQWNANDGGRL